MRFAILLPNVRDFSDPKLLVELAVAAEGEGWDGVFIWDELSLSFSEDPWPAADPWIAMAAIAQETERVRFRADDHPPRPPSTRQGRPRDGDS